MQSKYVNSLIKAVIIKEPLKLGKVSSWCIHGRTRTFYVINGYTEMTRTLGSTHVALRFWKILRFRALGVPSIQFGYTKFKNHDGWYPAYHTGIETFY